jgi:hypothetical protein
VIGIFKQKNPGNFIALLIFGVLIKLPIFLHPHVPAPNVNNGTLYLALLKFLTSFNPVIFPILAFSLILIQSILLTRIINHQRLMTKPNWFAGMAYMLITSLVPEWNLLSAPLMVNTILLFILSAFFKIYNRQDAKGIIFNIGLGLGIAALLFSPTITFIIWILIGLMLMRPFKLNEWVLCIIGVTTPYYFYAVWLFIADKWSWHTLVPGFSLHLPALKQSVWLAGSSFLLVLPFLTGGYFIQESLRKMLIQVRKGWSLILIYTFGAILIPFVNGTGTLENWVITAIPFAAFHASTYLYSSLRIIPTLLFWLSVAFILAYQYSGAAQGW